MLLFLAPIGLQRIVNEMTLHPRPASLRRTVAVETDHPRILFSLNAPLLKLSHSISILRRIPEPIRRSPTPPQARVTADIGLPTAKRDECRGQPRIERGQ